jgi:branched-chain amino acid transport system substrate-binding protein
MAAREILKALSDQHRGPDFKLEFQPGVKTFDTQLSGIGSSKPGVILVIAGPEDSAQLVVAIRKRLAEAVIFGTHQMGRSRFLQLAGKAAEDVHFPLLWTPVESDADTRKFIESFRARYGREPDYAAALSFDATRLLIAATRQGSLNRARIREALSKLSPWQGITGPIQWDGTGQNVRKVSRMGTITNGRIMPASDS